MAHFTVLAIALGIGLLFGIMLAAMHSHVADGFSAEHAHTVLDEIESWVD